MIKDLKLYLVFQIRGVESIYEKENKVNNKEYICIQDEDLIFYKVNFVCKEEIK